VLCRNPTKCRGRFRVALDHFGVGLCLISKEVAIQLHSATATKGTGGALVRFCLMSRGAHNLQCRFISCRNYIPNDFTQMDFMHRFTSYSPLNLPGSGLNFPFPEKSSESPLTPHLAKKENFLSTVGKSSANRCDSYLIYLSHIVAILARRNRARELSRSCVKVPNVCMCEN